MNVFGIGLPEMILIFVVALLIFGPKKLPEIGRSLGKAIRSFQDASREFESEFKREIAHAEQKERQQTESMQAELEPPQALTPAPETHPPVEVSAAEATPPEAEKAVS
jgi:sec-independent protein translocase protein TatA